MLQVKASRAAAGTACLLALSLATSPAVAGLIDLEWRPLTQTVYVGAPLGIGLYAVSSDATNVGFSAMQVIMDWDPAFLRLDGNDNPIPLMGSSFLYGDSFGINEAIPPADGDAMWVGMVQFGEERYATPAGTLLTTIAFTALAETPGTLVGLLPDNSSHPHPPYPIGQTKVLNLQSESVLGTLGGPATVVIIPEPAGLALFAFVALLVGARRR